MKQYRLEGRMDLLPENIWGGNDTTIYLPGIPTGSGVAMDPGRPTGTECGADQSPPPEPNGPAGIGSSRATGAVLFWAVDSRGNRNALAWQGGLAIDVTETIGRVRDCRASRSPRPWMTFCPFHPHRLPPNLRNRVRSVLGAGCHPNSARRRTFPRWPIEPTLAVLRSIAQVAGLEPARLVWPKNKRYAVCLSHDVDTADGQRAAVTLADIEQDLGLRSVWFLCPGNYQVDLDFWCEMVSRGHEIGCHGLRHDFKLPYLQPSAIGRRLDRARQLLETFQVAGFRSPAFLRTAPLLDAVADRFAYDSSIPDTVCLHGADGSAAVEPYDLGRLVEVPVTVPYDGELSALGIPIEQHIDVWNRKIDWIKRQQGLVHILTHPEPQFSGNKPAQAIYRRALMQLVADRDNAWYALPHQIAQHARATWTESTGVVNAPIPSFDTLTVPITP